MSDKIDIKPGVSILSVLKHLNYKSWYALAEFIDNSLDSYIKHENQIKKVNGEDFELCVDIEINSHDKKITIRDNAAGIHRSEFSRAFKTAEVPPDNSGLSEFGMGMKSASCWFTNNWKIHTKSINDENEYEIVFNIQDIIKNQEESVDVKKKKLGEFEHYTVVELYNIEKNFPVKKTIGKIKHHLTSIYRHFIRRGILNLTLNGESLEYTSPKILNAPFYKDENSGSIEWKKNISFDFGNGHFTVNGFMAIRETASTSDAGLALFRRGRVIEGSSEDGYRPELIFGGSNSFEYQRLFGELHLEGFGVSHTKDGFQWGEHEEEFLRLLKNNLQEEPIPLISQAKGYRKRPKTSDLKHSANKILEKTEKVIQSEIPRAVTKIQKQETKLEVDDFSKELSRKDNSVFREMDLEINGIEWRVHIEMTYDSSIKDWIEIGDNFIQSEKINDEKRNVGIRLSLIHPFMERFVSNDEDKTELVLRLAIALGLGEITAREGGVKYAGEIRRKMNLLLEEALSKP